jgi:nucleoside-diphosphate-sugar epimerase
LDEEAPLRKTGDPYGDTKIDAERILAAHAARGREPRLTRYAVRVIGRPYDYAVDRARVELGFEPRIDLAAGVRRWAAELPRPARPA